MSNAMEAPRMAKKDEDLGDDFSYIIRRGHRRGPPPAWPHLDQGRGCSTAIQICASPGRAAPDGRPPDPQSADAWARRRLGGVPVGMLTQSATRRWGNSPHRGPSPGPRDDIDRLRHGLPPGGHANPRKGSRPGCSNGFPPTLGVQRKKEGVSTGNQNFGPKGHASHPWKAHPIREKHAILPDGLKNMKETGKGPSQLRRHRRAMRLIGMGNHGRTRKRGWRTAPPLHQALLPRRPAPENPFRALRRSSTHARRAQVTKGLGPHHQQARQSSPTDKSSWEQKVTIPPTLCPATKRSPIAPPPPPPSTPNPPL
ncbi:MAG: hypothetical protein CM15mP18_2960 [Methanobacteriota archaeon]|nr:MAG: hypothetical protein CM15mP18_2960 [Euryarchaeota archaeon]